MKKCSEGYILLMTLCMITVITLLILAFMNHVLVYYKSINKQEMRHQQFYQLESLALQLVRASPLNLNCVRPVGDVNKAIHYLINNSGCSIIKGKLHYRYTIEDLGVFPCLVTQYKGNKTGTHHFRITLIFNSSEENGVSVLQLRYLKPVATLSCINEERQVSPGVSSWRYLGDFDENF